MEALSRGVEPLLNEVLTQSPVVVIEGARQVGKSTLVSMLGDGTSRHTTMDDELTRAFARDDPDGFLQSSGNGRLVIDEVQRCPELILPIKKAVDDDRRAGRFVLTGSANLFRVPGAEDSLAGRAITVRLHPFSQGEILQKPGDWVTALLHGTVNNVASSSRDDISGRVVRGGYPPVQSMSPKMRSMWLRDYTNRLLERDSSDLGTVQIPALGKLLRLFASNPGGEVVTERLARDVGVAPATISRYIEMLEALFIVHRLPAWSRNLTSRQKKRSKGYLVDTGVLCALLSHTTEHLASAHGAVHLGPILENFVVNELLRQQGWSETKYQLAHYRDRNGAEVDIVLETPNRVIAVEVKAKYAAKSDDFKHLKKVRSSLKDEFLAGVVLTTGVGQVSGEKLQSLPVSSLWS